MTFCAQNTRKIKFLGRGVLRDEFLPMWELSGWQSEHFLILSYGPKLISWHFVLKKQGKSIFWGEEFFGMSSYTCENFQLFILYNFQFHHMVLKQLPTDLNSIFDIFEFCHMVSNSILDHCTQKNRKIKFLGRGVLRDEFLHMWELSTFHSLQLSISSYRAR